MTGITYEFKFHGPFANTRARLFCDHITESLRGTLITTHENFVWSNPKTWLFSRVEVNCNTGDKSVDDVDRIIRKVAGAITLRKLHYSYQVHPS